MEVRISDTGTGILEPSKGISAFFGIARRISNLLRFLTKPCPPESLAMALGEGIEQYRLITAERDLLEKTLSGSVSGYDILLGARMLKVLGDMCDLEETSVSRRRAFEVCANAKDGTTRACSKRLWALLCPPRTRISKRTRRR